MADVVDRIPNPSQVTPISSRISRRGLLRAGAVGAVVGAGALSLGIPVVTFAKPLVGADRDVFSFVLGLLAARSAAVLENAPAAILPFYDPNNRAMLAFEVDRVSRLHHQAHDEWHGRHVRVYSRIAQFTVGQVQGGVTSVKVREHSCYDWLYDPIPIPASVEAERNRRDPDGSRRAQKPFTNPDGTTTSILGVDHTLSLQRQGSGYIVVADRYIEGILASPDAGGGYRIFPGGPLPGTSRTSDASSVMPDSLGHERTAGDPLMPMPLTVTDARIYADNWALSRNCSVYADWDYPNGGGDCANFVSQALYAGGIATDSTWNRGNQVTKHCPASSSNYHTGYGGDSHYTWVNNVYLRNWLLSSGHGSDLGGGSGLGAKLVFGDTVNYRWSSSDPNYDHITIVVQSGSSSSPALVDSHNMNAYHYSWTMGGAYAYRGTHVIFPSGCPGCS